MEPITKLLDKNVSQLRYEEIVRRGCFWPLSCRSAILGYSTHVTQAQFVVLSMAFFTFILYKSELLQIGTVLVVIDVAIKFLLLLRILRSCGLLDSGPSLTLFFLGMNVCKIYYSWY